MTKRCKVCGARKPLEAFYRIKVNSECRMGTCKECRNRMVAFRRRMRASA